MIPELRLNILQKKHSNKNFRRYIVNEPNSKERLKSF